MAERHGSPSQTVPAAKRFPQPSITWLIYRLLQPPRRKCDCNYSRLHPFSEVAVRRSGREMLRFPSRSAGDGQFALEAFRSDIAATVSLMSFPRRSALLPALGGPLAAAGVAAAAALRDEIIQIFLAVVDGDFFSRLDAAQCHEHDAAIAAHRLGVRPAGVIEVTRQIPSRRAVDGPAAVDLEHISRAASFEAGGFLGRDAAAAIGRDIN